MNATSKQKLLRQRLLAFDAVYADAREHRRRERMNRIMGSRGPASGRKSSKSTQNSGASNPQFDYAAATRIARGVATK